LGDCSAGIKAPPAGEESAPVREPLPTEVNPTSESPVSVAGAADTHSVPALREQLDQAVATGPRAVTGLTDLCSSVSTVEGAFV